MTLEELKKGEDAKNVSSYPTEKREDRRRVFSQEQPTVREEGRFEIALYVNDKLICSRNFQINGFIEGSMKTKEFKEEVDKICDLIDRDLVSKSRVYTWYHYWPELDSKSENEFNTPLIPNGDCLFKFVVTDNKREIICKCWDGYGYPIDIRKNVDITNRLIKITNKEGVTKTFYKESFFADPDKQLNGDQYVLRAMIMDKPNLVFQIQNMIFETTSSKNDYFDKISDYHTEVEYTNSGGNKKNAKKYVLNRDYYNKKVEDDWYKATLDKTKSYFGIKNSSNTK